LAHHQARSVERVPDVIDAMPDVLECHDVTGEVDYLLKVVVSTHQELERFLFDKLMKASASVSVNAEAWSVWLEHEEPTVSA
jgi:DNA-binding Lrp family transcriptional regulator